MVACTMVISISILHWLKGITPDTKAKQQYAKRRHSSQSRSRILSDTVSVAKASSYVPSPRGSTLQCRFLNSPNVELSSIYPSKIRAALIRNDLLLIVSDIFTRTRSGGAVLIVLRNCVCCIVHPGWCIMRIFQSCISII